jgi:hypothetical protein
MAANPESILDSVKHVIGFESEYTAFDLDITMHINMAFGILRQLGVGSDTGFIISDSTTLWSQYLTNLSLLSMVKTYIFMVVKMAFDPPATSFGIEAVREQIKELAFRINVAAEEAVPPSDPFAVEAILELVPEDEVLFEGGVMPTYFAPKVITLDPAPVVTPDASQGNVFYLTMASDCIINAPINGVDGEHITLGITSAGFHVTWGTGWNFGDGGLPSLSAAKTDIVSGYYRESSTEWFAGYTPGF